MILLAQSYRYSSYDVDKNYSSKYLLDSQQLHIACRAKTYMKTTVVPTLVDKCALN